MSEQAGSMINSRNTMCTGNSSSGQPERNRQHGEPRDGDMNREYECDGLFDVSEVLLECRPHSAEEVVGKNFTDPLRR
jgi:hypothetical protein